jgi:hypothetical protein
MAHLDIGSFDTREAEDEPLGAATVLMWNELSTEMQDKLLKRFETLLDALPPGYIFDGEIVTLAEDGRPVSA